MMAATFMSKLAIIGVGIFVVVGVIMFVAFGGGGGGSKGPSAQARFQARLDAAQAGSGAEQVVEGTVRATNGTTETPSGHSGVVAWTFWQHVSVSTNWYKPKDVKFGSVAFTLETSDGPLVVDGQLHGLSDLVPRNRSAMSTVTLTVRDGERVTVLGPISERDGVRGLYGEVIVVKGSYAEWHAALDKNFFGSLPRVE